MQSKFHIPGLRAGGLAAVGSALLLTAPAFAASGGTAVSGDFWSAASALLQDIYTNILGISTLVAVVCASVALILMNFSRSGRTVDESRAWLKRIVVTWIILNSLGFIVAYLAPLFKNGQWQPT